MTSARRPVMRYHGGKWRLAPWIVSVLPAHKVYVEPYGGAASVLLRKPRSYAEVYNDLDGETVNVFRVLRDRQLAAELYRQLELTPFARDEFVLSYEPTPDTVEQARRTIVRSFQGFGSVGSVGAKTGFRANSNRSGTTPARDWANLSNAVPFWISRMQGVVVENIDAMAVMRQRDSAHALFYVDPPYVFKTRRIKNSYCSKGYRHELTDQDHRDLLKYLSGVKAMVVLSGYDNQIYQDELSGWRRLDISARSDRSSKTIESLWLNPQAGEHRSTLFG